MKWRTYLQNHYPIRTLHGSGCDTIMFWTTFQCCRGADIYVISTGCVSFTPHLNQSQCVEFHLHSPPPVLFHGFMCLIRGIASTENTTNDNAPTVCNTERDGASARCNLYSGCTPFESRPAYRLHSLGGGGNFAVLLSIPRHILA
jgi:hypothetical protein